MQVPFRHIIYAEHFSHMIHIHTTGGKELITRQSFGSLYCNSLEKWIQDFIFAAEAL